MSSKSFSYDKYLIDLNFSSDNTWVKVLDTESNKCYNSNIVNADISIKPLTKFNNMLTRALNTEPNYLIDFKQIESGNKLKIKIKFSYDDVLDLEDTIILSKDSNNTQSLDGKITLIEKKYQKQIKTLTDKYDEIIQRQNEQIERLTKIVEENCNQMITITQHKYYAPYRSDGGDPENFFSTGYKNLSFPKNSVEIDLTTEPSNIRPMINPACWIHFPNLETIKVHCLSQIFPFKRGDYPIVFNNLKTLITQDPDVSNISMLDNCENSMIWIKMCSPINKIIFSKTIKLINNHGMSYINDAFVKFVKYFYIVEELVIKMDFRYRENLDDCLRRQQNLTIVQFQESKAEVHQHLVKIKSLLNSRNAVLNCTIIEEGGVEYKF